jgi:hypothetical protein
MAHIEIDGQDATVAQLRAASQHDWHAQTGLGGDVRGAVLAL